MAPNLSSTPITLLIPPEATATRSPEAYVAVLVIDFVAVAGGNGDARVRDFRPVGPGPEVFSVGRFRLVVDHPGGSMTKLVE